MLVVQAIHQAMTNQRKGEIYVTSAQLQRKLFLYADHASQLTRVSVKGCRRSEN